jgi:hypothetical protein
MSDFVCTSICYKFYVTCTEHPDWERKITCGEIKFWKKAVFLINNS